MSNQIVPTLIATYAAQASGNKRIALAYDGALRAAIEDAFGGSKATTVGNLLSYGIVPMRADGTVAAAIAQVAYVFMPHVLVRTSGGRNAGETMRALAQRAGFKRSGWVGTDRAKEAAGYAATLAAFESFDSTPKVSRKAKAIRKAATVEAPTVEAPTVEAPTMEAPIEA